MRSLPAGWPDPDDANAPVPDIYLYLPGSSWPPADAEKGLPAGYALVVGSGSIHREFTGALMPGQVRAPSGFTIASAQCVIANPSSGRLAPWKTGSYKIASGGPAELIASYDGPTGSTAFRLGKFRLDPIRAKASDDFLSVNLLDGMISLRQPNKILQPQVTTWSGVLTDATNNVYDPADLVNDVCTGLGISCVTPDLGTKLTSIWFDPKKDTLTCLQELVAANLAAITSDEDGAVRLYPFEAVNGGVAALESITVENSFDDLEFTLDPDDAYDRIELTYKQPAYVAPGPVAYSHPGEKAEPLLETPDWEAPGGGVLQANQTYETTIYPKRAVLVRDPYVGLVLGAQFDGSGDPTQQVVEATLDVHVTPISTGKYRLRITNDRVGMDGIIYPFYFTDVFNNLNPPTKKSTFYLRRSSNIAVHDSANGDDSITLSSGVDAEDAFNSLSIDLGVYIQNATDAQTILDRITAITQVPRFKLSSVRVPLDLRRQLVDSYVLRSNDEEFDLQMKGMVTSYDITWNAEQGEMAQTLDLAVMDLTTEDFDAAWDRWNPAATTDDFDAFWDAHVPNATLDDFDADPIATP